MTIRTQEKRGWEDGRYMSKGQLKNWYNLLDMANAIRYGFAQYRLPKPGQKISVEDSEARMEHIQKEWQREADSRGANINRTGSPQFVKLSTDTKCYLNSVLERKTQDKVEYLGF